MNIKNIIWLINRASSWSRHAKFMIIYFRLNYKRRYSKQLSKRKCTIFMCEKIGAIFTLIKCKYDFWIALTLIKKGNSKWVIIFFNCLIEHPCCPSNWLQNMYFMLTSKCNTSVLSDPCCYQDSIHLFALCSLFRGSCFVFFWRCSLAMAYSSPLEDSSF